jgi:2-polyprenyl-3-methyl-5-hydroxy-6-metoxy-1,4-benzoquinol methylase
MFGGTRTFRYMECTACGAVFQHPMPSAEEIAGFYPDGYSVHRAPSKESRVRSLKRAVLRYRYGYRHLEVPAVYSLFAPLFSRVDLKGAIPFIPHGELLDVGCGNGKFLLEMIGLGWRGMGVDVSNAAVSVCRDAGLNVLQGTLFDAVFESARFDVVTARHLIEHLPEPRDFVTEVARILKPGGRFVIETPNSRALARDWFGANWFANDVPRHLALFHPANLKRLVEGRGLTLVANRLTCSPKIILNSWDYVTGNKGRPSEKRKMRRLLTRPYVLLAQTLGRGDAIFQLYEKR